MEPHYVWHKVCCCCFSHIDINPTTSALGCTTYVAHNTQMLFSSTRKKAQSPQTHRPCYPSATVQLRPELTGSLLMSSLLHHLCGSHCGEPLSPQLLLRAERTDNVQEAATCTQGRRGPLGTGSILLKTDWLYCNAGEGGVLLHLMAPCGSSKCFVLCTSPGRKRWWPKSRKRPRYVHWRQVLRRGEQREVCDWRMCRNFQRMPCVRTCFHVLCAKTRCKFPLNRPPVNGVHLYTAVLCGLLLG